MSNHTVPPVADVLRYLADLADASRRRPSLQAVELRSHLVATGWRATAGVGAPAMSVPGSRELGRLASLDRLHSEERLLRFGWLWIAGTVLRDEGPVRVLAPLVTVPVEVAAISGALGRLGAPASVRTRDDLALNPAFIDDRSVREALEDRLPSLMQSLEWADMTTGLLRRYESFWTWVQEVLDAGGLGRPGLAELDDDPWDHRAGPSPTLVPGGAIYLARNIDAPSVAGDLRTWAGLNPAGTALDALYGEPVAGRGVTSEIRSAFPLNRSQQAAVRSARSSPVTVVAGPPGTGKSHTVAALAVDEVAEGRSVLIATQSEHAADVITDLLARHPGPRYVRFGSRRDRHAVADALAGGLGNPAEPADRRDLDRRHEHASRRLAEARRRLLGELEREVAFSDGLRLRSALGHVGVDAPGALRRDLNWEKIKRLSGRLDRTGPLAKLLGARAARRLRRLLGAGASVPLETVRDAVRLAGAERDVARGLAGGGVALAPLWDEFESAEHAWRRVNGELVEAVRREAQNRERVTSRALAALATALRSGRSARRRLFRELAADDFLDVLPLWIGTLTEIDDNLPLEPGVFDVVIVDEATQTDQMRAAPAVARAKRLAVFGDPKQLRHVSFTSDAAITRALAEYHLSGAIANILDVRRNSLFDAAAGAASSVVRLDEHFRSIPHIIGFSDRRFYGGHLRLMTQHPATEARDAIRVVVVDATRDERGVNHAQVTETVAQVRALLSEGVTSIGVVSPFRAQADALEAALVEALTADELDDAGLRVGTVHAFQGNERDAMIVSTAVGAGDTAGLRFLEDPNLFNVMVTRARHQMIVLTSVRRQDLPPGLLRDYLKHADEPPGPKMRGTEAPGWIGRLAVELEQHGVPVAANYGVAGHSVDLVVGEGAAALGVECVVHPDGPAAHVDRHDALRRAGWSMLDMFQSRWLANEERAVDELVAAVLARS